MYHSLGVDPHRMLHMPSTRGHCLGRRRVCVALRMDTPYSLQAKQRARVSTPYSLQSESAGNTPYSLVV